MSMMQAGCCCGEGACPACAGLPSTISVTISGTATDYCLGCGCDGPCAFTVSGSCILTKACDDAGGQIYRGVACDLATFDKMSFCNGGAPECLAHKLFASVCLRCSVEAGGVVTWYLYIHTYGTHVSEDCAPCSCEQLSNIYVPGIGNTCILSVDPYCFLDDVCTSPPPGGAGYASGYASQTGTDPLGSYSIDGMTFVLT